jgi:HD superfamily phosphohydrolase
LLDIGHGPYSHVYDRVFPRQLERHLKENPHLVKQYQGLP